MREERTLTIEDCNVLEKFRLWLLAQGYATKSASTFKWSLQSIIMYSGLRKIDVLDMAAVHGTRQQKLVSKLYADFVEAQDAK